ncbi:glycosyl-4,4'-diaponeurosporenoate acyltransferase [Bacillus sp. 165]|uniref:glycosyl-4,4'-diaponeurosporenoate acyltransferase CrtO family protein n=1 Tax=Bacillus sp. 165 TaxID=1529117 RepID=UPI001FFE0AED|nr:glycosyl-4,4'-diaponeurosporenoate acyltransferase [Bacillus sp. 165]
MFKEDTWLFKERSWEQDGKIYEKIQIKKWKRLAPDGGAFFRRGFRKKKLLETNILYLHQFVLETRRGELAHWLSIIPACLFFMWNSPSAGVIMFAYAILFNVPFILIQRYNRVRLMRVVNRKNLKNEMVQLVSMK